MSVYLLEWKILHKSTGQMSGYLFENLSGQQSYGETENPEIYKNVRICRNFGLIQGFLCPL